MKNISVISLGCDKNRVDTEKMLYGLLSAGFRLTEDFSKAEVIVVNTCAFIESARREAVETVLEAAKFKSEGVCEKLIVTGCLPQKYMSEIKDGLPEVDAFLGTRDYDKISETVLKLYGGERIFQNAGQDSAENHNRTLSTPAHYAYLKIAEGCDNRCTFCTIPSIRGGYTSRTIESLVSEAQTLVDNGVKELILVAQDVTRYGADIYGGLKLPDLIRRLSGLDVMWIRLLYCYPELVTDELIEEIDTNPKVAKYIDIPLQHYDDGILRLMNRRSNSAQIERLIARLRSASNRIAIRTTFMVGFPSETEEQFNNLYAFAERAGFDRFGVFAYSTETDTPSAKIKSRVPKKVKLERVQRLGALHLRQCRERNGALVGSILNVLYEDIDYEREMFKGRTEYDAPNVDTCVYFTGAFAEAGEVYKVKITGVDGYDLIGELVG